MCLPEMDAMMYKIEGEDLYLIGTSEHSMIGRFIDQIIPEDQLPLTLTSYSPCFRKEKGAHGIEERGVYRIHQFEKQEMIVVCKPEDSMDWYEKLWQQLRGAVPLSGHPRAPAGVLLRRPGRPEGQEPATLRPGAPASRSTSRSAPAPTWATPRPAASASASRRAMRSPTRGKTSPRPAPCWPTR